MSFELKQIDKCNYIELMLYKKKKCDHNYDIAFTELECESYINKLMNYDKRLRLSTKDERVVIYKNLKLTSSVSKDGSKQDIVTAPILLNKYDVGGDMICLHYDKHIVPTHSFPSSKEYFDIYDVKRTTLRILSNLYLNFESIQYLDTSVYNNIYFNINNKMGSTDVCHVSEKINDYIKQLRSASIC